MGIYREKFIPADPPFNGRYVAWVKGDEKNWIEAYMLDGEWRLPRGEGELADVHWFMDLGGNPDD
jgi:hypothetical protein